MSAKAVKKLLASAIASNGKKQIVIKSPTMIDVIKELPNKLRKVFSNNDVGMVKQFSNHRTKRNKHKIV